MLGLTIIPAVIVTALVLSVIWESECQEHSGGLTVKGNGVILSLTTQQHRDHAILQDVIQYMLHTFFWPSASCMIHNNIKLFFIDLQPIVTDPSSGMATGCQMSLPRFIFGPLLLVVCPPNDGEEDAVSEDGIGASAACFDFDISLAIG